MITFVSSSGEWRVVSVTRPMTLTIGTRATINREYLRVTRHGFHFADLPVTRDPDDESKLSAETLTALAEIVGDLADLRPERAQLRALANPEGHQS